MTSVLLSVVPEPLFASGRIEQNTAVFPVRSTHLPRLTRLSPLAEQASAGFAFVSANKGGVALQSVRKRPWSADGEEEKTAYPVCGQAPDFNSFGCWDLATGENLAEVPVPGQITTVPVYHDNSWFVGTSRGFFIRIAGNGEIPTPSFGIASQVFQGPDARLAMKVLSSSATAPVGDKNEALQQQAIRARFRGSWQWYATANAEFVGTPVVAFGSIFVLTANQSLNAYDLVTGELKWKMPIAPEAQLRLATTALTVQEKGLIVGTSDGFLQLHEPSKGRLMWRQAVSLSSSDRFPAVAASPLVVGNGLFVSNAESATQRLNLETRAVDWTYPMGSVVQVKFDDNAVYIAGSDGAIHKLDARTGQLMWRRALAATSPLVALTVLKAKDVLLASSSTGAIFALRLGDGAQQGEGSPTNFGPILGDFFLGRVEYNEVCLSYRTPGFACWSWRPSERKTSNAQ